jgi:hypothetical protein
MEIIDAVPATDASSTTDTLNMRVAITVALLATFMGICKVKDDNICQAMQQAQANKVDHWSFYQARNVREEVARSTIAQLRLSALASPPQAQVAYEQTIQGFQKIADDQKRKKEEVRLLAEKDQAEYDAQNFRDDQFDLSDALLAISISLLAITTLTRQRWLFWGSMIPTAVGVFFGIAGLFGLPFHPSTIMGLLS